MNCKWTSKCEDSFQRIKKMLTNEPILNIVDPNEIYVVCIDACKQDIGGVLNQHIHVTIILEN